MKNLNLSIIVVFLMTITVNAQKTITNSKKLPVSIYTFTTFSKDANSFSAINKRLNLANFEFVFVDIEDLDYNLFSIETKNIGKKPSGFIYDDYRRFQNNNLLKGFLIKNDPTRWNLHRCQNNFLPPKS